MKKIIVSDVFGNTPALIALGNAINANVILDPYDGINMRFVDEKQAYTYFTEHIGIEKYLDIVLEKIDDCTLSCKLIGFSVGASVIWQLSQLPLTAASSMIKNSICYYGSQIRHMSKLAPQFDVTVIFPKKEPHFDVLTVQKTLARHERVTTIQVDFLHGFMNTHSKNFNQCEYKKQLSLLR